MKDGPKPLLATLDAVEEGGIQMVKCTGEDEHGAACPNEAPDGPGELIVIGGKAYRLHPCHICRDRMHAWLDQFLRRAPRTVWPVNAPVTDASGQDWPVKLARLALQLDGFDVPEKGSLGPAAVTRFRAITAADPALYSKIMARVKTAVRQEPDVAQLVRDQVERQRG